MFDKNRYERNPGWKDKKEQREYGRKGDFKQFQHQPQRPHYEERPAEPSPINGNCNPLCPLFWCGKRAYQIRRDPSTGRKYVYCTWIGDECIGASCQYASCRNNYLLPDGSCAWVKQKKISESETEEEFIVRDLLDEKTKNLVSKKLGKKIKDEFL